MLIAIETPMRSFRVRDGVLRIFHGRVASSMSHAPDQAVFLGQEEVRLLAPWETVVTGKPMTAKARAGRNLPDEKEL